MQQFVPGQRWISDTDAQLGLGTVLSIDARSVTVVFMSSGETRTYAKHNAPLTRVRFAPGDHVPSCDGWSLDIDSVREADGILTYHGRRDDGSRVELLESQLDSHIQLNRPIDRLLSGQIDSHKWYRLRHQTLQHAGRLARSDLRGLCGGRTSLIPHQLYIAHEVANRYSPRVLLADEVGLGKTIEAGLILHHQWLAERAQRVLIVVPESLVHQWLVEMLRRFNLQFSVFDAERCAAIEESAAQPNPFDAEQLVLCSLEFLVADTARGRQASTAQWDLLIVDEAHHLQWSPQQSSPEYQLIEELAQTASGVLLLTATPEQLGKTSHFARLRLLDPDRFPDYDAFVAEEHAYEPVAHAVDQLLAGPALDAAAQQTLRATLSEGDNQAALNSLTDPAVPEAQRAAARAELIEHLLDRHGTGRVLFRNTRTAVQGFPARQAVPYPLPLPPEYAQCLRELQSTGVTDTRTLLYPEHLYHTRDTQPTAPDRHWTRIDPRVEWLMQTLRSLRHTKVLVITARAATAMDLAEALRTGMGLHAAVFHEGMTLVERDRAAAYFADLEAGGPVLVCSEMGSEGRNFQFAHHLVLFDLPLHPDLLEQRIGRLDRIGQTETVHIHVPYLEDSPQAIMWAWYHDGLDALSHPCPAGAAVFTQIEPTLTDALHQTDEGLADLPALLATTRDLHQRLTHELQRGRDRLLEYNACRPQVAEDLRRRIAAQDEQADLPPYMEQVFDCFGIDSEERGPASYVVQPGVTMQISEFPGLPEEGTTITYDRATALSNEDLQFMTWEHPMVTGVMENIRSSELGNTALTALKHPRIEPGSLLLECLFVLETHAPRTLQAERFMPSSLIRVLVDRQGRDHAQTLSADQVAQRAQTVEADTARAVARGHGQAIRALLRSAESAAQQSIPALLKTAQAEVERILDREINRLTALRHVNPNIRDEEIQFLRQQRQALNEALATAALRLDALRVIVTI